MVAACLKAYDRIDVLDNNVGIGSQGGPVDLSEEEWDKVFDVNVKSFFLTAKHVIPVMEKQGRGSIVNVSSIASIRNPKGISYLAYNASKGAVNSLTLAIASQYAEKGIRCNAIAPGLVLTEAISRPGLENFRAGAVAGRFLKQPQTPEDLAGTLVFLASPDSDFVTGQIIVCDGGSAMH